MAVWREYVRDLETLSDPRGDEGNESAATASQAQTKAELGVTAAYENRKTGDWTTYKYYIQALGSWRILIFLLLVAINATLVTVEGRHRPKPTDLGV